MEDVWAPPSGGWTTVSPRLATARRVVLFAVAVPVTLAFAVLGALLSGPVAAFAIVVFGCLVSAIGVVLIDRQWRAIGFAEREDDLLVKRGVMFRQLTVVPYGRMQFVDVTAGPLDRRFGVATVQLHTASAATDASIPGLSPDEAARLRDHLAALGEARSAGL